MDRSTVFRWIVTIGFSITNLCFFITKNDWCNNKSLINMKLSTWLLLFGLINMIYIITDQLIHYGIIKKKITHDNINTYVIILHVIISLYIVFIVFGSLIIFHSQRECQGDPIVVYSVVYWCYQCLMVILYSILALLPNKYLDYLYREEIEEERERIVINV